MSEEKIHVDQAPPEPQEEQTPDKAQEESKVDYEKSYKELQQKFGEHSNLVGDLRKQNEDLATRLSEVEQASKEREEQARNEDPPNDYEKALKDILKKSEEGDISPEDALRETALLTREISKAEAAAEQDKLLKAAEEKVVGILSQKDQEVQVQKFHEQNPDFAQFQQSEDKAKIMGSNPMHDDFSAYWAWKAENAKVEALAEAERLKSGSEPAKKVLADTGSSMQTQRKSGKGLSEAEAKASMLNSLT